MDPKAIMYLLGSRMDFVVRSMKISGITSRFDFVKSVNFSQEDAVKAEFVFENPNAKGSCGCGESFNV